SLWELGDRSKAIPWKGMMAQKSLLLSSRSLNGREFPQNILKTKNKNERAVKESSYEKGGKL
ncbi:hypothetical protein, partial [Anaerostipes hadrus]|uniref:hypothetical protein n=1 Tax=Anaerostipes hadrus TaxID=649756 RepID=UPI0032BFB179